MCVCMCLYVCVPTASHSLGSIDGHCGSTAVLMDAVMSNWHPTTQSLDSFFLLLLIQLMGIVPEWQANPNVSRFYSAIAVKR